MSVKESRVFIAFALFGCNTWMSTSKSFMNGMLICKNVTSILPLSMSSENLWNLVGLSMFWVNYTSINCSYIGSLISSSPGLTRYLFSISHLIQYLIIFCLNPSKSTFSVVNIWNKAVNREYWDSGTHGWACQWDQWSSHQYLMLNYIYIDNRVSRPCSGLWTPSLRSAQNLGIV